MLAATIPQRRCALAQFCNRAAVVLHQTVDFVGDVSPRVVVLGHGEEASRRWFEEHIRARYPRIKVLQPAPGTTVEV